MDEDAPSDEATIDLVAIVVEWKDAAFKLIGIKMFDHVFPTLRFFSDAISQLLQSI